MYNNQIVFDKVGNIETLALEIKPFTLFVGRNNTGKTLLINALFFIHSKNMKHIITSIIKKIPPISYTNKSSVYKVIKAHLDNAIEELNKFPFYDEVYASGQFPNASINFQKITLDIENEVDVAALVQGYFEQNKTIFDILVSLQKTKTKKQLPYFIKGDDLSESNLKAIQFLENIFPNKNDIAKVIAQLFLEDIFSLNHNTYMFPVERAGINTFLFDVTREINRFGVSLQNYLELINDLKNISSENQKSEFFDIACMLENSLFNGTIHLKNDPLSDAKKVYFTDSNGVDINASIFSSSINELSTFILYLKLKATKGDLIFIDEPEISLHPDAQRIFIRYLTVLNNLGLNFVIITHSDYILKELSHTISLGKKLELMQNDKVGMKNILTENSLQEYILNIHEEDCFATLKQEAILYSFDQNTNNMKTIVSELNPSLFGFNEKIFNTSIENINITSNSIAKILIAPDDEKIFDDILN